MSKIFQLQPQFVKYIPEELKPGVLYISEEFQTVIHLCACGMCGKQTVTPTGQWGEYKGWDITINDGKVTLNPSIGNWQFPCKSHYFIRENRVEWC